LALRCSNLCRLSPCADEDARDGSSGDMGRELTSDPFRLLMELKDVEAPGDMGPAPGLGTAFLAPTPSSLKSSLSSASLCAHLPLTEPTSMLFLFPAIE
jgi:hypothetical protein